MIAGTQPEILDVTNCLLIPVHPPKTNWLMGFLNSLGAPAKGAPLNFRIVIATSNYDEFRFFNRLVHLMPCSEAIDLVCVESYLVDTLGHHELAERYRGNVDQCIVNLKKLVAISWAVEAGYEWIACIDCDVSSLRDPTALFPHLIRNYESGLYFGTSTDLQVFRDVTGNCSRLFGEADQQRLRDITRDDSCYAWFFDVPFYKAVDYTAFLSDMAAGTGSVEAWLQRITYHSFEHVIFLMWRCLHRGARLIDLADMRIGGIPEFLGFQDLMRIRTKHGYEPAWVPFKEMLYQPDILQSFPNVTLSCHVDRF